MLWPSTRWLPSRRNTRLPQPESAVRHEPDAALPVGVLRSVRRLTQRRGRDIANKFLVEGRQAVREALAAGDIVEEVVVDDPAKHADLLDGYSGTLWRADESAMRQLSDTVTPQGVIAVCRQLSFGWEHISDARLVVICSQVRDPGNAGTVIRCADAFGADAVILTTGSVDIYNPKVVRSTVGSLFHMPILTGVDLRDAVDRVHSLGLHVLAADGEGEPLDLKALRGELRRPTAWIMGNEAWGLPVADRALADEVVAVPMWGGAESLNLSSAAAVCLYATASAQRRNSEGVRNERAQ
ncbi:RNA methyltransferase [Tessaracoccus sp. OH4464_COT-324]|nr:RNA methyltransferase [Tessaracoccus sp. OH4464_COT-324]